MLPVLLLLVGCVHTPRIPGPLGPVGRAPSLPALHAPLEAVAGPPPAEPRAREPRFGETLADAATWYLDHEPVGWRQDCSGFVCAAAERAGWGLRGNTRSLWELAEDMGATHKRRTPSIGDLAFFDNTYDRNRNGKNDDELTHVAVVVGLEPDGTILLAHAGTSSGRSLLRMNLLRPGDRFDEDGKELNGWLRRERSDDRPGTPHLAGEAWRGFASLDPPLHVD